MSTIVVSASQFKTFESCERKWWFERVAKLPTPVHKHFAFGTALHGVIERWLKADDTGRDATGKPVVLYPEGWHIVEEQGSQGVLTIEEQDLIRKLIEEAIAGGHIVRLPGRQIESELRRPMFQVADDVIELRGYMDVVTHSEVQDHKTSKNTRWFLSKDKLQVDVQLLLYAAEVLFRAQERGEALPDKVTIRHNQFLKDPDRVFVKHTAVDVTLKDIQNNWMRCVAVAQRMWQLRSTDSHLFVQQSTASCGDYGGCPFLPICSGMEKPETYRQRMKRLAEGAAPQVNAHRTPPMTGGDFMGVFDSHPGAGASASPVPPAGVAGFPVPSAPPGAPPSAPPTVVPPAAPPAAAPAFAPAPTAPVAPPGIRIVSGTPWGVWGCRVTACQGLGLNSAGQPCGICVGEQRARHAQGKPAVVPEMFQTGADGQGYFCWRILPDYAGMVAATWHEGRCLIPTDGVTAPVISPSAASAASTPPAPQPTFAAPSAPPAPPVTPAPPPVATPAQIMAPASAPPPPAPPAPPTPQDDEAAADAGITGDGASGKRGRPVKGITVFVNCVPTKGGPKLVQVDDLFNQYAAELAKAQGATSYYHLRTWERRDMMAQVVGQIVVALKTSSVVCRIRNANDDIEHFAKLLMQHATTVVEALPT